MPLPAGFTLIEDEPRQGNLPAGFSLIEDEPFPGYGGFGAAPRPAEAPSFGAAPQPAVEQTPVELIEQQVAEASQPPQEPAETREQIISRYRNAWITKYPDLAEFLDQLEADETLDAKAIEREFLYAVGMYKQEQEQQKEAFKQQQKKEKDDAKLYEQFMREQQRAQEREQEKIAKERQREIQRVQQQEQKAVDAQLKADTELQKEAIKQGPTVGQQAGGLLTEVAVGGAGQVAGALLAPFTAGISYPVLSFAGGFAGSLAAQEIEGQDRISYGRAIRDGLLNLLPGAKPAKAATRAGQIAKTVARGAAIGAGAGAAGEVIETGIEEQRLPTLEEIQAGAAGGAVVGGAFTALGEAFQSAYRKFAGRTTAELDAAYNAGDPDARLVVDTMKKTAKDAPEDVAQTLSRKRSDARLRPLR
jgi:hypothetical protein